MEVETAVIQAQCPLYACLECRTKTGWPHQCWCSLKTVALPDCEDCRYWSAADLICKHPIQKKVGGHV